jgi:hypothetical protein
MSRIHKNILKNFNYFLEKCETSFRLVVVKIDDYWIEKLSSFVIDSGDCHTVEKHESIEYAVVAFSKKTNEIASYVNFSVLHGSLGGMSNMKSFVKEYISVNGDVNINSIILEF